MKPIFYVEWVEHPLKDVFIKHRSKPSSDLNQANLLFVKVLNNNSVTYNHKLIGLERFRGGKARSTVIKSILESEPCNTQKLTTELPRTKSPDRQNLLNGF